MVVTRVSLAIVIQKTANPVSVFRNTVTGDPSMKRMPDMKHRRERGAQSWNITPNVQTKTSNMDMVKLSWTSH